MNADELLRQWIEAERGSAVPAQSSAAGWQRLASAVGTGMPALSVPLSTIQLTTVSMVTEGAAVALVVGAIGATAIVATAPHARPLPAASPATSSSASVSRRAETAAGAVEREPESPLSDLPVPVVPTRESKPIPSRVSPNGAVDTPAAIPSASTLDAELQLLGRAKREIDRGQPHLAQVWLDEHRARFPLGVLAAERDGLKVLMACGDANSPATRAKAEAFLLRYPGSPLLDRIRRACHLDPSREDPK